MPKFSRITIIEAIEAFQFSTHATITKFELRFGIEKESGSGVEPRVTNIIKYLIEHPNQKGPNGANLVYEMIEHLLELKREQMGHMSRLYRDEGEEELFPKLARALRRDGYVIQDYRLMAMMPEELQLADKSSELEQLLLKHIFTIPKGHLDQALSAYSRGDWAAANGQLRPFIESLFDEIARNLDPTGASAANTTDARRHLLASMMPPFFLPGLNEWLGPGTGFVQGFWRRLHPSGPHPGLSDEDDCTFRLHLVMVVANHFMRRFDCRI